MDSILLTICARGGSEGVKGKNIKNLNGRPLISYTINQGIKWGKAKRVIVSTDSDAIVSIAKEYGAEVPFMRTKELATSQAGKLPVIRDALLQCEAIYNEKYSIIIDLDVTAPIRTLNDLDNCLLQFNKGGYDSLFSVVEAHKNPYFNMVEKNKDGKIKLSKKSDQTYVRRQDLPKVYSLNASIYFYRRDYILNKNNISPLSNNCSIYVMNDISGIDIDREIDYRYIEFLIKEKMVAL